MSLAKHLRLNKGPLKEKVERPDGVLLFLGPTGVGKTELAKALAEFLFGDEKKMIRLDMSEYKDSTVAVDKLIGMPRGIVGSERGGVLTNQIRDNPYTVVLLDEVEKANPYVLNLFLQVFDEGWLTDGRGKRVYFSDAVIIMTSNLGSDEFKHLTKPMGFLTDEHALTSVKRTVMKEVENTGELCVSSVLRQAQGRAGPGRARNSAADRRRRPEHGHRMMPAPSTASPS